MIKHASKTQKALFQSELQTSLRQLCLPGRRMLSWYSTARLCAYILILLFINLISLEILYPSTNYPARVNTILVSLEIT